MRVIACDDGRVAKLGGGATLVSCVAWSRSQGVEDLGFLPVHVDGLDATSILSYLVSTITPGRSIDAVLLDSLTIAGFNVVSPDSLYKARGAPVIVAYSYKPSYERLHRGLMASGLPLLDVRGRILRLVDAAVKVSTPRGELYVIPWGTSASEAEVLLALTQGVDRRPIPLRIAHYISSALSELIL